MAHQESTADHETMVAHVESLRLAMEQRTGHQDLVRDDEHIKKDVFAFPRVVSNVDTDRTWSFHEAAFFCFKVDDVYKPVIDKYGRYPYRNAIEGRDSTDEEREWIEKTDHFAEASPAVAGRVKEDVAARRWTPLGQDDDDDELASVRDIQNRPVLYVNIRSHSQ